MHCSQSLSHWSVAGSHMPSLFRTTTCPRTTAQTSFRPHLTTLHVKPVRRCRHSSVQLTRAVRTTEQEAPELSALPAQQREPQPEPPHNGSNDEKDQLVASITEKWPAKRPFAAVAFDKTLDTAGDILMHVRRQLLPLPTQRRLAEMLVKGSGGAWRLRAKKPVLLVLGSGWGAHSLIKVLDTDLFEVVVVSKVNHFVFTPMLPSSAVGTVEFRSLLEPVRISNPFVTYFEANCEHLDIHRKVAVCESAAAFESGRKPRFEVPYDIAVVAVGEKSGTFGVPGVEKYAYFMKEITDAVALRRRVSECFELAALPGTTEEVCRAALHFVVVGGGPTGVEFAGTLRDFVSKDLKRKFPELMQYVKVTLIQSASSILTQFDAGLQAQALQNFEKTGVTVRTGVRVTEVTQDEIVLKGGERLEYGLCVWSTGNAARPLVKEIIQQVEMQKDLMKSNNPDTVKLAVDPYLRVMGADSLFALGDCSAMVGERLPATAQVAGQQGAYVGRLANQRFRVGAGGMDTLPPSKPAKGVPPDPAALRAEAVAQHDGVKEPKIPLTEVNIPAFLQDSNDDEDSISNAEPAAQPTDMTFYKPFEFLSLGLLAYVGNDKALTQVDLGKASLALYGNAAYLLWRSVYITKQVSFRNRVLILFDWMKAQVFGRDLSQF